MLDSQVPATDNKVTWSRANRNELGTFEASNSADAEKYSCKRVGQSDDAFVCTTKATACSLERQCQGSASAKRCEIAAISNQGLLQCARNASTGSAALRQKRRHRFCCSAPETQRTCAAHGTGSPGVLVQHECQVCPTHPVLLGELVLLAECPDGDEPSE